MNIFMLAAAFLLIGVVHLTVAASTTMSRKFNRDFITNEYYVSSFNGSITNIGSMSFTNTFLSTVQSPIGVYYTTTKINIHTNSINYSLNPAKKNVEYYVQQQSFGTSYLITNLTGFLHNSIISQICFKFLIVLNNNRIFNTHISIKTITFTNTNPIYTPFPSKYSPGDSIYVFTMLRDLKLEYLTADQANNGIISMFYVVSTQQPDQKVKSSLVVSSYFNNPNSRYAMRFLLVIIDQTRLQADYNYKNYMSGIWTTLGFYYIHTISMDIKDQLNTYIAGASGLYYINNRQSSFYFTIYTNSNTQIWAGCNGNSCTVTYAFWITQYYDCPGPQWIERDSLCYDNCTNLQYFEYTNNSCTPCPPKCQTCIDSSSCSSCFAAQNRILSNVSCIPMNGYYDSGTPVALACDSSCWTCTGTATACTSCHNTSLLDGTTCKSCSDFFQGCAICNQTACFGCLSTYRHINQTYCNVLCADPNCEICSNSNNSLCFSCKLNAYRVLNNQGLCAPICGDGVVMDNEQCDDGNLDVHDGCNSSCMPESDYTCTNLNSSEGYLYTAYCSYHLALNFTLLTQQKLESSNSLRFILTVDQYQQSFWKSFQSFDGFVSLSVKHSNLTASFISQWNFDNRLLLNSVSPRVQGFLSQQYFQIVFEYLEQLHNLSLKMSFAFDRSNDPRVRTIPAFNRTFTVLPENNQYAHLYLPETYQQQSTIKKIILAECIILMIGYVIASFCRCKRIIAETIMVAQTAFVGLVTVQWTNPLHSAVKSLSVLFNPLNLLYSQSYRPFDDPLLPNRLRGMGLYSNFHFNLNTGLAFVIVPLLVGVVLKLLSLLKCFEQQRKKKLSEYWKAWLTDFMLAGLTILGCSFGCNMALEIQYAIKDLNYSGIIGIIFCSILSLLLVIYIILWLKKSCLFLEYYNILNRKEPAQLIFVLVYFCSGLSISITSFMLFNHQYTTVIIISYSVLLFLYVQFKEVYLKSRDKIRVQINLLTIALIQSVYLLDKWYHGYSHLSTSSLFMNSTIIIPLALAINLTINLAFLTYQIVKTVREWLAERTKQKMQNQEKHYMSQKSVEMRKLFQNNQENSIKKIKFRNPLLEDSEANQNYDSAKGILHEQLNKFLELEKLQAQRALNHLKPSPKQGSKQAHLKGREKYGKRMILDVEYKQLENI